MYVLIHMYSKLQLMEKRPRIWKEWERTNTRVCVKEKKTIKANKLESHEHTHTKKKWRMKRYWPLYPSLSKHS